MCTLMIFVGVAKARNSGDSDMMPIVPLTREHSRILRMVNLMKKRLGKVEQTIAVSPNFVDVVVDFLRTYADMCHHGKEEDILFRDLTKKHLSLEHRKMMSDLVEDHILARKVVGRLADAGERHLRGNRPAIKDVNDNLMVLIDLYPRHIEKEDKYFFPPSMEYLTEQERNDMLNEFWKFDRELIHEKYRRVIEGLEEI